MIDYIDFLTAKWLFLFIFFASALVCSVLVSMIMDLLYDVADWFTMSAYHKWHDNFVRPIKFYLLVAVLTMVLIGIAGGFAYYLIGVFKNVW